ncbi:MAG: hypothetical protein ACNS63_04210 [Candidatus Nitrospinota bacterium M3_3B_026]
MADGKTAKEIIEDHLTANGYGGLYLMKSSYLGLKRLRRGHEEMMCECLLEDLAPCGGDWDVCKPGYRVPCDCAPERECEFEYHISPKRPVKKTAGRDNR